MDRRNEVESSTGTARIERLRQEIAYRPTVDILATLGPGEKPLITDCNNKLFQPVTNRFSPLDHSGDGDNKNFASFFQKVT